MTFFRKISFCQGPNSFKQHLFYTLKATGEGYYFDMWLDWAPEQLEDLIYDLPIGEAGLKSVQLALSSDYYSIGGAYDKLLFYAQEQKLHLTKPFIERYFVDSTNTSDIGKYITEISIKIAP